MLTPNGIIANLYDPVEGCRHVAYSGLQQQLELNTQCQEPVCPYGNPAYPLRVHLQGSFANQTPEQFA